MLSLTGFCNRLQEPPSLLQELWSDLFVVKGVDPGKEQVSAQLVEPGFPPLEHSVALTVAEAFSLLPPSPVLIIPGTRLDYKIVTYRPDKLEGEPVFLKFPWVP